MKLKTGDAVEVLVIDHSTNNPEGWQTKAEILSEPPELMAIRGYYVGETSKIMYLAFAKCGSSFSTTFLVVKSAIVKIAKSE